ncbi:rhodanese-related sulfurtransferase [Rivularia sp. PCC 7116]|uniref:sulfurtransferase n=1 Tax=Rivularia sp. PCC 7116 TaxID=373994 RepID=UPI00029EC907|nr:sulfurtransferase [Rivularia sp. PCC 7116]AFY55601.1 rhodanese-related sulfurtransferase [Rivularia sp. PCC 7116]
MPNYVHPEVLVDTQWLAEHLNDEKVRIVEVNANPQANPNEVIPGAVLWNSFKDLMLPDYRINLDKANIEEILSRSGIANNSTIIVYGEVPGVGGWIFWLLKIFGHQDVRILNGGRRKWVAEKRPLAPVQPVVNQTLYSAQEPDGNLRVLFEDVCKSINQADRVIVDVRTPQEYSGEWFYDKPPENNERAGHILSAVHVYYESALNEDGTLKPIEELRNVYESKDITPDKTIIPYCAVGARSAHTWFVLKYLLGYPNVLNYDGSWNEWSRREVKG